MEELLCMIRAMIASKTRRMGPDVMTDDLNLLLIPLWYSMNGSVGGLLIVRIGLRCTTAERTTLCTFRISLFVEINLPGVSG